jgi:predicted amidohydrolase YtcJ
MTSSVILTADRIRLDTEAPPVSALRLAGGRVVAAGTEADVAAGAPRGTQRLHFPGATVTPGLTDSHVHLSAWALARRRVSLAGCRSLAEGLDAVRAYAARNPDTPWILGQGWDRNRWGGFPTRHGLDAVVPGRPVLLESQDTHASWLNGEALRRCGIDDQTADPPGGRIERDGDGRPTGILLENAKQLAVPHLPSPGVDELMDALLDAQREAHRLGITGVHSVEVEGLRDFGGLEAQDRLRLRVLQHLPLRHLALAEQIGIRSGWRSPGGWIRIGGVKMFLDGALGSRTAWMREPYVGTADDRGIRTLEPDDFREIVGRLERAGLAVTVHAIGDAAVELALDVLESAQRVPAIPHRIEHLQLCPPELWERVARSGVVASMQPCHLLSDVSAAERHWGHARCRGAYALGALARAGATLAFGSDVPVEPIDPREGLFAAIARVDREGRPVGGWFPEHALTARQALDGYTTGAAAAAGEHGRLGRLLSGYHADLVVWDRDPLQASPDEIRAMRCIATAVAGEFVHGSDAAERV